MKSFNVTLREIYLLMEIYGPQFITLCLSFPLNKIKGTFLKSLKEGWLFESEYI